MSAKVGPLPKWAKIIRSFTEKQRIKPDMGNRILLEGKTVSGVVRSHYRPARWTGILRNPKLKVTSLPRECCHAPSGTRGCGERLGSKEICNLLVLITRDRDHTAQNKVLFLNIWNEKWTKTKPAPIPDPTRLLNRPKWSFSVLVS